MTQELERRYRAMLEAGQIEEVQVLPFDEVEFFYVEDENFASNNDAVQYIEENHEVKPQKRNLVAKISGALFGFAVLPILTKQNALNFHMTNAILELNKYTEENDELHERIMELKTEIGVLSARLKVLEREKEQGQ